MIAFVRPVTAVVALALALGQAGLGAEVARAAAPAAANSADEEAAKRAATAAAATAAAERAREHIRAGEAAFTLRDYPTAIREFDAAYRIKQDPALLYNIAQSHRLAGDLDGALYFYRALQKAPNRDAVKNAPDRTRIDERIKELEEQIARNKAAATQPPSPGLTPTPTPMPPTTSPPPPATTPAPGATTAPAPPAPAPARTELPPVEPTVTPSEPVTGTTAFGPTPVAPTSSGADRAHAFVLGGRIALGVAGGMMLIGIIQGLRASGAAGAVEDDAAAGRAFDPADQNRGQSAERAQWWWLGIGTLIGAGGAAAWYYGNKLAEADASATRTPTTPTAPLSFAPLLGPGRAGAWLRVTF